MNNLHAKQYPPLVRWIVTNTIKTRLWFADISDLDFDDMLQEAWITVFRYQDKPQGYQFKAGRHAVLNYYHRYVLARKNSRNAANNNQPSIWEERASLEATLNEKGEETVPAPPPDPDDARPLPIQGQVLEAFLRTLYPSYHTARRRAAARAEKDAFVLLLLSQGYNSEGIAHEMGTNPYNVRARRRHLRLVLQAKLEERNQ